MPSGSTQTGCCLFARLRNARSACLLQEQNSQLTCALIENLGAAA